MIGNFCELLMGFWKEKKKIIQALNFVFLMIGAMVLAYYLFNWSDHEHQSLFHRIAPALRWILPILYLVLIAIEFREYYLSKVDEDQS